MIVKTSLTCAVLAVLFSTSANGASEPKSTEARSEGLLGPVRSVSAKQELQQIDWGQKDAKAGIIGVSCYECEFDVSGNRIRSGQILDGVFNGDVIRIIYDETGKIKEKIHIDSNSEVKIREVWGPHGVIEQIGYENGQPILQFTANYDANGHMAESRSYDGGGMVTASRFCTSDVSGENREEWDYGPDGSFQLHLVYTSDSKSGISTFENFDENGSLLVAIVGVGEKLLSYWQRAKETPVFGTNFFMDPVGRTQESYSCRPDGTCDEITSYFADEATHQVSRVEWHDPFHVLRLSFDYEYQLDQFGNWTTRTVWVWTPELGDRKLAERDSRTITYWNK